MPMNLSPLIAGRTRETRKKNRCFSILQKFLMKSSRRVESIDKGSGDEDDSGDKVEISNEEGCIKSPRRTSSVADFIRIQHYQFTNILPLVATQEVIDKEKFQELSQSDVPSIESFDPTFSTFSFSPRRVPIEKTPLAVIAMMRDLDIVRRWCIPQTTLARFVLMVQLSYRDPPYHNWQHAFCVTHFAYLVLKNLNLINSKEVSHLEALAFFISALCHDLDHRGTSNAFQIATKSALCSIYPNEQSVMERHHLSQASVILNLKGCNILYNLTKSEVEEYNQHMKNIILATDLGHHFTIMHDLQDMVEDTYNRNDPSHHHLVLCLLITSSDLSDQTKDWLSATSAAKAIYQEFFNQGDLEKAMGIEPIAMMDRDRGVVTDLQLSFIEKIAVPVYKLLAELFPKAVIPYRGILANQNKWIQLRMLYQDAVDDPDIEAAAPYDLQAILNQTEFEGAEY